LCANKYFTTLDLDVRQQQSRLITLPFVLNAQFDATIEMRMTKTFPNRARNDRKSS